MFPRIDVIDSDCNTGFIPSSLLTIFLMIVMWECSHRVEIDIVRSTGKSYPRKAWIGALAA